jgi:hypothetical protein
MRKFKREDSDPSLELIGSEKVWSVPLSVFGRNKVTVGNKQTIRSILEGHSWANEPLSYPSYKPVGYNSLSVRAQRPGAIAERARAAAARNTIQNWGVRKTKKKLPYTKENIEGLNMSSTVRKENVNGLGPIAPLNSQHTRNGRKARKTRRSRRN